MTSTDTLSKSPIFLRMAGHPIRWRLLTELGRSDRKVRELTEVLGEPQSLVSYHLGQLRAGGLVSMRRSASTRRRISSNESGSLDSRTTCSVSSA